MDVLGRWVMGLLLAVALAGAPVSAAAEPPGPGRAPASDLGEPTLPGPSVFPVDGSLLRGFEPPGSAWGPGHRGVDLAARIDESVRAAAGGTIAYSGVLAGRGVVVVDHGSVRTTYEPVVAGPPVGTVVIAGQRIGRIGASASARGQHCARSCLHWGLRFGDRYLDPLLLLGGGAGEVRLVGAGAEGAARRAARARATAQRTLITRAALAAVVGPGGAESVPHGFLMPVPVAMTSPFGRRLHPLLHVWKLHDGTDFGAPCGAPIRAPHEGRVAAAYFSPAYGNRLMIDHGVVDGRHVTSGVNHAIRYVVGVGQPVARGQVVGYVGRTGLTTGCHLHLMLWLDGGLVNPMTWW